jgi:hypothetical protein
MGRKKQEGREGGTDRRGGGERGRSEGGREGGKERKPAEPLKA